LLEYIQNQAPVLRLRHYLEVLFQSQQAAKPIAKNGMIVRDHDTDLGPRGASDVRGPIESYAVVRHTLSHSAFIVEFHQYQVK
jgi:hypothetical protein